MYFSENYSQYLINTAEEDNKNRRLIYNQLVEHYYKLISLMSYEKLQECVSEIAKLCEY